LHGLKDSYYSKLTFHKLFYESSNPLVIEFNEPHKFPRCIDDEGFAKLKRFVRDRYLEKNGEQDGIMGFQVDYDKFDFEIKF
jgi:hypothetical protein